VLGLPYLPSKTSEPSNQRGKKRIVCMVYIRGHPVMNDVWYLSVSNIVPLFRTHSYHSA